MNKTLLSEHGEAGTQVRFVDISMFEILSVYCCHVLVGANFASNDSLSSRYTSFLTSHALTSASTFLFSDPTCVIVATRHNDDPLIVLQKLAQRYLTCKTLTFVSFV